MAFVSSFAYCDGTSINMTPQGFQMQIGTPLSAITPVAIPGNFTFSIACNIADINTEENNFFRIRFLSPGEETIFDTQNVNIEQTTDGEVQKKEIQLNIEMRNIIFSVPGEYKTEVYINHEKIGEYPIDVYGVNKS